MKLITYKLEDANKILKFLSRQIEDAQELIKMVQSGQVVDDEKPPKKPVINPGKKGKKNKT